MTTTNKNSFFLVLIFSTFFGLQAFADAQPAPVLTETEVREILGSISADVPGANPRCLKCHEPTMNRIVKWAYAPTWVITNCLESPDLKTAEERLKCFYGDDESFQAGNIQPTNLGVLAAGAHTDRFKKLFLEAFGPENGQLKFDDFVNKVGMPKNPQDRLSDSEIDKLYAWLKAGMPFLEKILAVEVAPENACVPSRSPLFDDYLEKRKLSNWSLYHTNNSTQFFGCTTGTKTDQCFTEKIKVKDKDADKFPQTTEKYFSQRWNAEPQDVSMRLIAKLPRATAFWTRSSPDGRYLGAGLSVTEQVADAEGKIKPYNAMIVDLSKSTLTGTSNGIHFLSARYDPTFTPDGLGFMFNGLMENRDKGGLCPVSILKTDAGRTVEFDEPGCLRQEAFTYQSMGSSLDNNDTYVLTGIYNVDDAGGDYGGLRDPEANWGARSFIELLRFTFENSGFNYAEKVEKWTPFYGDWAISSSTEMVASRVAGLTEDKKPKQLGYQFFTFDFKNGALEMTPMLRVCNKGAKGNFSFDERYFVYHHYVEEDDFAEFGFASADVPEFQAMLREGTANVYWMDLKTGVTKRITRMEFGQYAVFPHFRADGWIYFTVRDRSTRTEWQVGAYVQ